MFVPTCHDQVRKPAASADSARGCAGKTAHTAAPAPNPVWQSLATRPSTLQPKLAVGRPGDAYEQEADRTSEQVMRMPQPRLQRACACGGGCSGCRTEEPSPEGRRLLTKRVGSGDPGHAEAPPLVQEVLRSPGQPLDPDASLFFEPRLGHDFAGVRVHADAQAADSARAVNARAYTVGRDVVFAQGQYQPATTSGRHLLAHELAHVVQQSGAGAPRLQAKVVDDDEHLPCRSDPDKNAAVVTASENKAAKLAEDAVPFLRAQPLGEKTRLLLWKKFRLDYNDPRTRCQLVPEIADRLARIARDIRSVGVTYNCTSAGEPAEGCSGHWAATRGASWPHGADRIDLCSLFWRDKSDQGLTLLHEWAHYVFWTSGLYDELPGGFDTAGCYSAFALEVTGGASNDVEDSKCVPNEAPLPDLDPARVGQSCPSNVFLNFSLTGGFASGLPGRGDAVGGGVDLLFPRSRMHESEFSLGARFLRFAPEEPTSRAAYLFGIRAGLQWRQHPWRGGWQVGTYAEAGAISTPEATGDRVSPYLGVGGTVGRTVRLSPDKALQFFVEVGGKAGFDAHDSTQFGSFQAGLGVSLEID